VLLWSRTQGVWIGTDGNNNGFDVNERNVIAGNLWSRFLNVDNGPTNVTIAGIGRRIVVFLSVRSAFNGLLQPRVPAQGLQ
jgi:hypothetical protein